MPGPPCAWCGAPSIDELIIQTGTKNRKTAPVCRDHAREFEARGLDTLRTVVERKLEAERKRREWKQRNQRWR